MTKLKGEDGQDKKNEYDAMVTISQSPTQNNNMVIKCILPLCCIL